MHEATKYLVLMECPKRGTRTGFVMANSEREASLRARVIYKGWTVTGIVKDESRAHFNKRKYEI